VARHGKGNWRIAAPPELKSSWSVKKGDGMEPFYVGKNRLSMPGDFATNGLQQCGGVNIVYRVLLVGISGDKCSYWFCLKEETE
jgi:hypothetical protein